MSGLSSRVMTMKFMQKADSVKEQEETNKVKDTSEWVLPNAALLVKKANKKKNNISESVGYGSINSFGAIVALEESDDDEEVSKPQISVRKTYGKKEEPLKPLKPSKKVSDLEPESQQIKD